MLLLPYLYIVNQNLKLHFVSVNGIKGSENREEKQVKGRIIAFVTEKVMVPTLDFSDTKANKRL